jgi:hypothetical protein
MVPAAPSQPSAAQPSVAQLSIPGFDLEIVDVVGPAATPERVAALQELHSRFFPEYPHVLPEIAQNANGPGPYPGVVVHQWLLQRDAQPVGLYLFDTNTRRGIVLRHFVALSAAGATGLSPLWLGPVAAKIAQIGAADCEAQLGAAADGSRGCPPRTPGTPAAGHLLGGASEIPRRLFPLWRRLGFCQLDQIGYAEPHHGMHWAQFDREPRFHDITLNLAPSPIGQQLALRDVADAAARAFLLDHYRLPVDNPRVVAILAAIAAL